MGTRLAIIKACYYIYVHLDRFAIYTSKLSDQKLEGLGMRLHLDSRLYTTIATRGSCAAQFNSINGIHMVQT